MTVEKRIKMLRMAEKMDKDKKYAEKLGLKNKSYFKTTDKEWSTKES